MHRRSMRTFTKIISFGRVSEAAYIALVSHSRPLIETSQKDGLLAAICHIALLCFEVPPSENLLHAADRKSAAHTSCFEKRPFYRRAR